MKRNKNKTIKYRSPEGNNNKRDKKIKFQRRGTSRLHTGKNKLDFWLFTPKRKYTSMYKN